MHILPRVTLKPGRESTLLRRHPWVFSGAIASADSVKGNGETVDVVAADGRWLARGAWSAHSQIRIRAWSFEEEVQTDAAFFRSRISRSVEARRHLLQDEGNTACRLIFGESDGLPGLIVDKYDTVLVCQFLSAGSAFWKDEIVSALCECLPGSLLFERSDNASRSKEGLRASVGVLGSGDVPEEVEIRENGLRFFVDVRKGHKTGWYLDQRLNRANVGRALQGARVLNCFCYTGAFTVHAHAVGATGLVQIDSSADALGTAEKHLQVNGCDSTRVDSIEGNVFEALRQFREEGERFDAIILDPPKFASSAAQVQRATRGYKDINMLAMQLLRPGGLLSTFSCSGHISAELFQKIVAGAALDAGREARIEGQYMQAPDHPVLLSFPESAYLKGLACRVF